MHGADFGQRPGGILVKPCAGISAEKGKPAFFTELVPQLLEPHGGCRATLGPKQSHHLAKGADTAAVCGGALEKMRYQAPEKRLVRPSLQHEGRKSGFRIQRDVSILDDGVGQIDPGRDQPLSQRSEMFAGGDNNDAVAGGQSAGRESRQGFEENAVVCVELGDVLAGSDFAYEGSGFIWFTG
ncbi:MAG TPA: hypothetical protein VLZ50_15335 [Terracidiphilus sp.]|nr:hypothetical protein [Terracidiphilus sp.]